ncbi:MAG: hypothetical protein DRI88_02145 [Bacteroidetes bacterium]|nr:MAG: hypothetical protein DRI88_02145 [Bacteroidota bacterium]RLD72825.1 MAG: hypothetical protein DRI87_05245 [Bacteroidota bacterium]RLD85460.1 MAG: hypothetical protein DRJ02_10370 [Bacteroidota bacterium]
MHFIYKQKRMLSNYEIKPNKGLGELEFGMEMDQFIDAFGKPEEIDSFDDDEELNTTVLHYWTQGFSIFFVGLVTQILAGIETDHPETTLYGEKIMNLTEDGIVELMKNNGHTHYEVEIEEEKDRRLSYDYSMIDFFFRDGKLVYMNFGVLVDEQGNIETV